MAGKVVARIQGPRGQPNRRSYRIPGELPTLPFDPTPNPNPGIVSLAPVDVNNISAAQKEAFRQERDSQLDFYKNKQAVIEAARMSPGVAAEAQALADDYGMPAFGKAVGAVRRAPSRIPGEAPDVPGGPSLPPFEERLARETAEAIAEGNTEGTLEIREKALKTVLGEEWEARKKRAELIAQYNVEMDQQLGKPAVDRAVEAQRRADYNEMSPYTIARQRGQARASQEEQTTGFGNRLARETTEMDARIPKEEERARRVTAAMQAEQTQGDVDRTRKGLHQRLQLEPIIQREIEKAKNEPLGAREQKKADVNVERVTRELKLKFKDFEERENLRAGRAGKWATAQGIQAEALKEAYAVVTKDPDKLEDLMSVLGVRTPGEALNALYEQFVKVGQKAKMDPTARAVMLRFGGK